MDAWAAALESTIPHLFARNAAEFAEHPALTDGPRHWTWRQAREDALVLAAGLAALGLQRGQTMLIAMSDRAEHWLADTAAAHLGAVSSTVHPALGPEQVRQFAQHCRARVVVLEGTAEVHRWYAALRAVTSIDHVVVLDELAVPSGDRRFRSWKALRHNGARLLREDSDVVERHWRAVRPEHPAAIVHTHRDGGEPRGVVLTHRNVCSAAAAVHHIARAEPGSARLCYLPLAHIAERMSTLYSALHDVAHVHFCGERRQLAEALVRCRPAVFFGDSQVWEELASGIRCSRRPTARTRERLRARVGLDRTTWSACGAPPVKPRVRELFASLGVEIAELWGMPETTGCVTAHRAGRPGGEPLPGAEVRIAADGEVLVRGPLVCAGYLQPDGVVRSAADADGWLPTGDLGSVDAEGRLTVTGRKPA
ncbi:hypothetical protein GCM10025787_35900 [Saccharopolyspora rosea]|uniref:AMP-binding protein n=1 Tax=Saccharopolyspora rosea TaxID=524884 RepID=A0ABW3FZA8_9PSEU